MIFRYTVYRRAGLFAPASMIMFAGVLLVVSLLFYVRKQKHSLHAFLSTVAPALCLLAYFVIICFPTLKHSIHLLYEKERDALTTYGTVESIIPVENSPRYSTEEDGVVRAAFLIIDGEKYYFMTSKGLDQGDSIQLQYLPKSRMVLQWEKHT